MTWISGAISGNAAMALQVKVDVNILISRVTSGVLKARKLVVFQQNMRVSYGWSPLYLNGSMPTNGMAHS